MKISLFPVILAGGKGERFWPLSRRDRPKQFLSLDGSSHSLLQATANRLLPLAVAWDNLWVRFCMRFWKLRIENALLVPISM